ncbi:MAG: hypothetical protein LUI14_13175 [Lachnospiraceae bacterium]|nr:hypothetical protein [Lachnospiraceae bacterium]
MEPKVELINNPYKRRLKILIDGTAVSVYSNLEKYMDEPFLYWCGRILDEIYEECNRSKFRLHFCSRQEEITVMERIASEYPNCVQFSSNPLVRSTPLQERMKSLSKLLRDNRISGYKTSFIHALFVLSDGLEVLRPELEGLEVKNSYCHVEPDVMSLHEYQKQRRQADITFFCMITNLQVIIF